MLLFDCIVTLKIGWWLFVNVKLSFVNSATFTAGRHISPHSHNCHEIVFYGIGCSGTTVINDTEYTFSAGDVAVINQNSVHYESHLSDGKVRFLDLNVTEAYLSPTGFTVIFGI